MFPAALSFGGYRVVGMSTHEWEILGDKLESAGFRNVYEQSYLVEIGQWHSDPHAQDVGGVTLLMLRAITEQFLQSLELHRQRNLGDELEVDARVAYIGRFRAELENSASKDLRLTCGLVRRWAQKPVSLL